MFDIKAASKAILTGGRVVEAEALSAENGVMQAGEANALVLKDVTAGGSLRGERAALVQGALQGEDGKPCRIEVDGDLVVAGSAEHAQVSAETILVGGSAHNCQLVARTCLRVAGDVADSRLVAGDMAGVERRVHSLKDGARKGTENCDYLDRQLTIDGRRLGKLLRRSTYLTELPDSRVLTLVRDELRIDLTPFYEVMQDRPEGDVDQALDEFFTKGVIGVLARLNRHRIEGKAGRQQMFLKLSQNLHALFKQTRERDKVRARVAALKKQLEETVAGIGEGQAEVHVAGELLPGVELTMPRAVVNREGREEVFVSSVAARMVVKAGEDDDHLQVTLKDTEGNSTDQAVEAIQLQAVCFRLRGGKIVWEAHKPG